MPVPGRSAIENASARSVDSPPARRASSQAVECHFCTLGLRNPHRTASRAARRYPGYGSCSGSLRKTRRTTMVCRPLGSNVRASNARQRAARKACRTTLCGKPPHAATAATGPKWCAVRSEDPEKIQAACRGTPHSARPSSTRGRGRGHPGAVRRGLPPLPEGPLRIVIDRPVAFHPESPNFFFGCRVALIWRTRKWARLRERAGALREAVRRRG